MPASRNRKKKKTVKKNRERSMSQLKEDLRLSNVAPAPIKMKYFEAQMEGLVDIPFEDRLEMVRKAGQEAAIAFPDKYKTIQHWFKSYDQAKMLAFCFYYFVVSPAGYDEEAVKGSLEFPTYYQELLQAFALTSPRTFNPQPFSEEVGKFKKDFKEIGELNRLKHFALPDSVKNAGEIPFHMLRAEMMMHTTAVRNWSYDHQMKKVTLDLAALIKDEFKEVHGFDPVIFLELIYQMTLVVEERVNEHRLKTVEIIRQKNYHKLMDTYESLFPVQKSEPPERREIWARFGKNLKALQSMYLVHSDYFLEDLFTFSYEELAGMTGNAVNLEKINYGFDLISMEFGDLKDYDPEHFLLGNPVHDRPFIKLSEETVFSSLWAVMTHLSIGLLENFCNKNEKLRNKYNNARGSYLESETARLFKTAFPMASVYAGSKWKGTNGKEYENDLLVIIDKFAIVVEAKAGLVSPPARRGAPDRLFKTLQELIEEPSEQALRFIEFLKSHPEALSLKVKKGPNNRFDAAPLKYFIPLGVTLSHLGMTGSNLKQLIDAGVTSKPIEELATSVSLTDLQVVFDLLPLTAEKVHYLQRRRELEANVKFFGDELDLLAWYLDNGFNLGRDQEKYGLFMMDMKSKELDQYIIGSVKGEKVEQPYLKKTKWWNDILTRLQEKQPQTWLESSYVLLNLPEPAQKAFAIQVQSMKAKMQNGTAEYPHNWILMSNDDNDRQFVIAGYGYHDHLKDNRYDVVGDILYDENMQNTKGKLVIGMNIDKPHYPYSVLGGWLASDLFDNRYLKMISGHKDLRSPA